MVGALLAGVGGTGDFHFAFADNGVVEASYSEGTGPCRCTGRQTSDDSFKIHTRFWFCPPSSAGQWLMSRGGRVRHYRRTSM